MDWNARIDRARNRVPPAPNNWKRCHFYGVDRAAALKATFMDEWAPGLPHRLGDGPLWSAKLGFIDGVLHDDLGLVLSSRKKILKEVK